MENCFYCSAPLYRLSDGRVKCMECRRRYSPAKIARELAIVDAFCRDLNAKEAAEALTLAYPTVSKVYGKIRQTLLPWLEERYERNRERIVEYDETLYLDHNKRADRRRIFDAYNYLTFDYEEGIYTLLMPSLQQYKSHLLDDGLEEVYYRELSDFLHFHRVARLQSRQNRIERFWRFFDEFMKRYKGVRRENFVYYLKEAEFKFNVPLPRRLPIIEALLYDKPLPAASW